jgi:hypothetical protein
VGRGDLREAGAFRDGGERLLVRGIAIPVHQHDGAGAEAARVGVAQRGLGRGGVERGYDVAVCTDALVDLHDFLVEHRWQLDVPREDIRAILVGDAEGISKSARRNEQGAVALALEQRVGGDRRAHAHGVDELDGAAGPGATSRRSRMPWIAASS